MLAFKVHSAFVTMPDRTHVCVEAVNAWCQYFENIFIDLLIRRTFVCFTHWLESLTVTVINDIISLLAYALIIYRISAHCLGSLTVNFNKCIWVIVRHPFRWQQEYQRSVLFSYGNSLLHFNRIFEPFEKLNGDFRLVGRIYCFGTGN